MKCSSNLIILSFALHLVSSLVQTEKQLKSNKRTFNGHEKDLLSDHILTLSSQDTESTEASTKKRFSTADARHYNAVNIPVPFHRVHYRPIHVARPVAYSKKPDVYINHVHVHNGVNPCQHSGIILHTPGGFECLCKKQYKGKHCEEKNYCYPNPCVNKGNCVERQHSFVCKCLNGFKGATCSEKDPCARNACKHGGTCVDLGGSKVQCSCPVGFKGKTCEEIEHCDPSPCLHGGTCKENDGKFVCSCVQDWKGSICEVPRRCLVNPCRNGGQCIEGQAATVCKCKQGFYGPFCQDNVCQPNPCFNKGKCSVAIKSDKTWTYKCQCQPTFEGKRCQIRNRCALKLCKNGVCIDDSSDYHVDLPLNGYLCICKDGFQGENCDRKVCDNCHKDAVCLYGQCICKNGFVGNGKTCKKTSDICSPNPCKNSGKCVHAPKDSYDCVCVKGFTGPLCETVTLCDPNPCKNGATCVTSGGIYRCMCPQGRSGPNCDEVKKQKCTPTFCQYGGVCKEPEDPTKPPFCVCKTSKFVPPNCACSCEAANKNVDPSAVNPVCDADGDCICQDASKIYVPGSGCIVGRTDPCLVFLCQNGGTKERSGSTCICRCPTGYTGPRCETKTGRQCVPNPCKNRGTCEESLGRIKCNCLQGFRQPFCEKEIAPDFGPCLQNPCKNGGKCLPLKQGYDCLCSPQFTGPHCEVDKCLKCHTDANCIQGVCTCKENFVGNGYNCIVELDKSDSSCFKCPSNTVCNSGVCQCRRGYIMNKRNCIQSILVYILLVLHQTDGKIVNHKSRSRPHSKTVRKGSKIHELSLNKLHGSKINITESGDRRQFLTSNNVPLQSHVQDAAQQTVSSLSTSQDQELTSDSLTPASSLTPATSLSPPAIVTDTKPLPNRQLIDPAGTQPGIALNRLSNDSNSLIEGGLSAANLPMLNNSFLPNGIELEKPLPVPYKKPEIRLVPKLITLPYSKKPDVHVSHVHYEQGVNPCQNGGLVVQSPGGYSCVCRKQFRGKHCQERDHCFPNPCKNGGNCIDHVTHFQCRCGHKFRGLKCEVSNTCAKSPCKHGATCLDLVSGLRCVCPVGYKGKFCADFDYCNPNPCKNGAKCTEKGLGVSCICTNEYKGNRCEVKKVCLPNPCRNNGKCLEDKSSAPCQCAQGFTGKYCAENVCKPSPCLNGGVCAFKKSDSSSTWLPLCKCALIFKGEKCEIPNPCAGKPSPCKHGACSDAFNGRRMDLIADHYVCTCDRGYMGSKCDVRICDKCDKNAKCLNKECVCNDGYVGNGLACKKLPDPCVPNPCKNFGVCIPIRSSYDCRCPFSFVGARCEQQL